MAAEDATAYVYENVGVNLVRSTDGAAYVYENVGRYENQAWSCGIIETDGRPARRHAVAYVYENVTT